jgi:hypothetical protein
MQIVLIFIHSQWRKTMAITLPKFYFSEGYLEVFDDNCHFDGTDWTQTEGPLNWIVDMNKNVSDIMLQDILSGFVESMNIDAIVRICASPNLAMQLFEKGVITLDILKEAKITKHSIVLEGIDLGIYVSFNNVMEKRLFRMEIFKHLPENSDFDIIIDVLALNQETVIHNNQSQLLH